MAEQGATNGGKVDLDLDAVLGGERTVRLNGAVRRLRPLDMVLYRRIKNAKEADAADVGRSVLTLCLPDTPADDIEGMHPAQVDALVTYLLSPVRSAEGALAGNSESGSEPATSPPPPPPEMTPASSAPSASIG